MITRAQKAALAGVFLVVAGFLLYLTHGFGRFRGRAEAFQERRNECYCGTTRTCVFGPGIVGTQVCLTGLDRNEWSRCEPAGSQ